jgi:hypothetical protein
MGRESIIMNEDFFFARILEEVQFLTIISCTICANISNSKAKSQFSWNSIRNIESHRLL